MQHTPMSDDAKALVEANLPLVRQIVHSMAAHYPRHADRDELLQAGALGLIEAANRFDPANGAPFERWASVRIRGAVVDSVRDRDIAPRGLRTAARELEEGRAGFQRENGRSPNLDELGSRLGITGQQVADMEARVHRSMVLSLDVPAGGAEAETTETLGTSIVDEAQLQPVELLEQREQTAYLVDAVACLPDRLRVVVSGYFLEGRTSAELAEQLGVTESRVSQLRTEALELMRHGLSAQLGPDAVPADAAADKPVSGRVAYRADAYAAAVAERSSFSLRLSRTSVPSPRTSTEELVTRRA